MPEEKTQDIEPLTMKEIDDFLVKKDKNKCPWCNGNHWALHVSKGKTLLSDNEAGLRTFPKISLQKQEGGGNTMTANIDMGTSAALAAAVAECQECGHLSFFSYFTLMRLIRDTKEE